MSGHTHHTPDGAREAVIARQRSAADGIWTFVAGKAAWAEGVEIHTHSNVYRCAVDVDFRSWEGEICDWDVCEKGWQTSELCPKLNIDEAFLA